MTSPPPDTTTTASIPAAATEAASLAIHRAKQRLWEGVIDPDAVARTALAAALPHLTPPPGNARERMLVRRIKAQEELLVCYRLGKRPSEKLFREMDATRTAVDDL